MTRNLSIIIVFLIFPAASWSQAAKGNAANADDPRVVFVSPAATALYHSAQIVTGYELLYAGLNLRNGFAAFSYPHSRFGTLSFTGQYFLSDIYRTGNYLIGFGRAALNQRLSFGVELGVISFSFNSDNFRLNDIDDPVFRNGASKTALDVGFSMMTNPADPVYLGMSVKHLNKPNMSLIGDNVRMPMKFQASVMLRSAIFNPLLSFEYFDDRADINLGLERWFFDNKFLVRTNYDSYNIGATVGFVVPMQGSYLQFEYEYRYPLSEISDISNASHQVTVALGFLEQESGFDLTVYPMDQSVFAGESAAFRATVSRIGRFNSPIELMLISPDNDFPTSAVPQRLKTEKTSVFVVRTSEQTPSKSYHFNIYARAEGQEKIVPISLAVKNKNHSKEKAKESVQSALAAEVRSSVDRLVIKETTKIRSRDPLLPYVFFEENKAVLDEERYNILNPDQQQLHKFTFSPGKLLDIPSKYKNTLNVIAKRLWDNPQMEIVVRGYNSNWGAEKGNIDLSRRRAESVRNYLVDNCGVGAGQVKIEAHQLPPDPASNLDPRGREENQRVEISCPISSQPILDPIVTETSEIATSDEMCRFKISNVVAGAGLKRWKLVIMESAADTFKIFEGKVLPESDVIWDWKNDEGKSVSIGTTYRYQLHLQDKNDQAFVTSWKAIQVEKVRAIEREYIQKNIEKTRLILFKYDRADMDLTSKSLREELDLNVQKLKSNSEATLLIQGHTDVIGGVDYNAKLSLRRAESVARYFADRGISRSRVSFEGFGMDKPLMTNNLPEGRMMNRRVEIYILY